MVVYLNFLLWLLCQQIPLFIESLMEMWCKPASCMTGSPIILSCIGYYVKKKLFELLVSVCKFLYYLFLS